MSDIVFKLLDELNYSELIQVSRVLITYINSSFSTRIELPDHLRRIVDDCYNRYEIFNDEDYMLDLLHYIDSRINSEDDKINFSVESIKEKFSDFFK